MWSLSGPYMMQLDWFGAFTEPTHPPTKNIESFERVRNGAQLSYKERLFSVVE